MSIHYLTLGNAIDLIPSLKIKVDAVITDPPYNTANKNVKKLKGRKALSSDFGQWDYFTDKEYLSFTKKWISGINKILKDHGNLITFSKLEYVSDIRKIYESLGFKHHGTIIWHKTNPSPSIRKNGFLSACEAILWATKGFDEKKISYTFNFSTQKEMHNFVETPICMGHERTKHPTQKPKRLFAHLVKIFTAKEDTILDPFAGSGTLAETAIDLDRNSINIEIDINYYRILKERINSYVNNLSSGNIRLIENAK